jgi:acylphosphatase
MKLRIRIIGPKVHDVGYRYFLMSMAMANRIRRFEAHNIDGDTGEEALVLVDGGEQEIQALRRLVEMKRRPERAEVSRVVVEDYEGEVMTIGEYAQFCTTVQMNKAIPLLLDMVDKQEETISEIRGLRGDLAARNNIEWQARIEKDIRVIKSKLGIR